MKKFLSTICLVLATVIAFSCVVFTNVSAYQKGDINHDNSIDVKDVNLLTKYLLNIGSAVSVADGDLNNDNVVDTKDLLVLRATIANVEIFNPDLPVGVDVNYSNQLARSLSINGCDYNTVAVNQIGYSANGVKKARLIEGRVNAPATADSRIHQRLVYLVDVNTNKVAAVFKSKRRSEYSYQINGTDKIYTAEVDISSFTTPGKYCLYAPAGRSVDFVISESPYNKAIDDLTMAFYYQRCGGELSESVLKKYDDYLVKNYGATANQYYNTYKYHARNACHVKATHKNIGKEVVVVDQFDESTGRFVGNTDSNGTLLQYPATDFAFGMHDAGDYGRYTQPAAQTVCDLLAAYELNPNVFNLNVVQDTNGKGSKDNLPDILDHARWEAKFLLNMQAKTGNAKGGFYFKICTSQFASAQWYSNRDLSLPENEGCFNGNTNMSGYTGLRAQHVNFADTAYAVTALAYCYSVFKDADPTFANQCLTAAKAGYDFYINGKVKKTLGMSDAEIAARDKAAASAVNFTGNPWTTGGGSYSGTSGEAVDCMWGAIGALYRATGDSKYLEYVANTSVVKRFATEMGTHSGGGFGSLAFLLAKKEGKAVADDVVTGCQEAIARVANNATDNSLKSAFFNIQQFGWGSNPRMANAVKCNSVAYSLKIATEDDALTAPRLNLSYMLGVNPENWCFITGATEYSSKNIHHYPSVEIKLKNPSSAYAPGLLAGGYTNEAGPFRYDDNKDDHVCNEVCIYWNSSAIFAFASIVHEDLA